MLFKNLVAMTSIISFESSVLDVKAVYEEINSSELSWQKKLDLVKDLIKFSDLGNIDELKKLTDARSRVEKIFTRKLTAYVYTDMAVNRVREVYSVRKSYNIQAVEVYLEEPEKGDQNRSLLKKSFFEYEGKTYFGGGSVWRIERQDEDVFRDNGHANVQEFGTAFISRPEGLRLKNTKEWSDELLLLNFVHAKFNKKGADPTLNNLIQVILRTGILYLVKNSTKAKLFYKLADGGYQELGRKNKKFSINEKKMEQLKAAGMVSLYVPFFVSPSGQRSTALKVIKVDSEDINEIADKLFRINEKDTLGTLAILMIAYKEGKIPFEKLAKFVSRLSLPYTGSCKYGEIKSFAFFNGKMKFNDVEYSDGQGAINALVMIREHDKRHDLKGSLSLASACGNGTQARFGAVKGFHPIESPSSIKVTIEATAKRYSSTGKITFVRDDEITVEFLVGLLLGEHKDEVLVFGTRNLYEVDFFGDLNVFKSVFDFRLKPFDLRLMEMSGKFKGKAKTSLQMLSAFLKVSGAEKTIKEIVMENLEDILEIPNEVNVSEIRSIESIKDILYPDTTLRILNSGFVRDDKILFESMVSQIIQTVTKVINRMNLKIEGSYAKIIKDKGLDFGVKILKDDEIFVGEEYYKNVIADLIRYPHNDSGEHFLAKCVSLKVIYKRIIKAGEEGKITLEEAKVIWNYYRYLKQGLCVVPSANPRFARLLGGCDYDGDGVMIYVDRRIIKMAVKVPSMAIDFGDPRSSGEMATMDIFAMNRIYDRFIANANEPIGVITNRNMAFISLASVLDEISEDNFAQLIQTISQTKDKDILGLTVNGVGKYQRRYTSSSKKIDADEVDAYWKAVKETGIHDKENMKNILLDASPVNSSCGGRTIDSGKTNEKVFTPLSGLGQFIKAGMLQDIGIEVEKDITGKTVYKPHLIETGFILKQNKNGEDRMIFVANDLISQIKNWAAKMIADKLSAL